MIASVPLIYFGTADNRPPVRIRSKRNMICRPLGCSPRPVVIGEEITISDRTLQELTGDDLVFLGRETSLAFDI